MDISVIGNAESIFDKQDGPIIDQGDMIIRFNKGIVRDPKSQGSRTTILVFSYNGSCKNKFGDVEFWNTKVGTSFDKERDYLQSLLHCRPSNGLILLERLKNDYSKDTVRMFGFDWKDTPTWCDKHRVPPHDPDPTNTHNWAVEKEYCLDLIKQMKWELY